MTTGTTPDAPPVAPIRRWAADLLGLPATATPEQARAEYLRLLSREDFVPWLPQQLAFATLNGVPPLDARDLAHVAEEERWSEQVEEFGATLFESVPADRGQRWADLKEGCAPFPRLKERLKQLEPAVSVTMLGETAPPQARQLGIHLFELARLRPTARAVRRAVLLRETRSEESSWEETARWLQRARPDIAALDKTFVDALAQAKMNRRQEAALARRALDKVRPVAVASPEPSSSFNGAWRFAWLGILVLGALMRAAGTSSSPYIPPAPPAINPPQMSNSEMRDAIKKLLEKRDGRNPNVGGGGLAKPVNPNDPFAPKMRPQPTGTTDRP